MSKNIGKNKSKNLSGKYSPVMLAASQKLLDHAKNLRQTTSKTVIKKKQKQMLILLLMKLRIKLRN